MSTGTQSPEFEQLEFNPEQQQFYCGPFRSVANRPGDYAGQPLGDLINHAVEGWYLVADCAPATVLRSFRASIDVRMPGYTLDEIKQKFAAFVQGEDWPDTPEGWAEWPWYQSILATAEIMAQPDAERYYNHIKLTDLYGEPFYFRSDRSFSVGRLDCGSKKVTGIGVSGSGYVTCQESPEEVMMLLCPNPPYLEDDEEDTVEGRTSELTFGEALEFMRLGLAVSRENGFSARGVKLHLMLTYETGTQGESVERFVVAYADNSHRPSVERIMYAEDLLANDWYVIDPPTDATVGSQSDSAKGMSFSVAIELVMDGGRIGRLGVDRDRRYVLAIDPATTLLHAMRPDGTVLDLKDALSPEDIQATDWLSINFKPGGNE